jgi:hypothetical protein
VLVIVSKHRLLIYLVQSVEWVVDEVWADLLEDESKDVIISTFDYI